jgi:hypothetical protein
MALTSNTNIRHSHTQTKDLKESVLDMVVDTAPMQVPLMAMAHRGTNPLNTKFEWVLDYSGPYPTSQAGLVRGEGDDANPGLTGKRTRLFNYSHIWGRAWSVSHTAEVVDAIGIDSEFDYQAAKHARLTVRDFNYLLLNSQAVAELGDPNDSPSLASRQMSGLRTLIETIGDGSALEHVTEHGSYIGSDGTTETLTSAFNEWRGYYLNNAPATALTTAALDTALKTLWERGGLGNGVVQVLANGTLKQAISTLYGGYVATGADNAGSFRRSYGSGESTEIVLPVDTITTDFGEMHVHLDQSCDNDEIVGFDPEWFHLNVLRDFEIIELAKTGPSQHGMIEAEMTCSLLAPNTAFCLDGYTA